MKSQKFAVCRVYNHSQYFGLKNFRVRGGLLSTNKFGMVAVQVKHANSAAEFAFIVRP